MSIPGLDFASLYSEYRLKNFIGVDDWTDRLSYFHSFIVFLSCAIIVTCKTYLFQPIACHVPTIPSGSNFKNYVESFCWVIGTIPLRINESVPENEPEWKYISEVRRINYYQWVPFILGLQCILFYLPRLTWTIISFNKLGTDLNLLITNANKAKQEETFEKRQKVIKETADKLELLLFSHRDRQQTVFAKLQNSIYCFGNRIIFYYGLIKIWYLINSIIQLYLMKNFLNHGHTMLNFGLNLLNNLLIESHWTETLHFPRIAYCPLYLRHLGTQNNFYLGICALPINMLNEKIYIFLFFWVLFVFIFTSISLPLWLLRLATQERRSKLIRKYLIIHKNQLQKFHYLTNKQFDENIYQFVNNFLHLDGVFLIHILTINVGDVVTGEIVQLLWKVWLNKCIHQYEDHINSSMSSNDEYDSESDLELLKSRNNKPLDSASNKDGIPGMIKL